MKCYRKLEPIKAISFDLDDTLYSNRPNILAADQKMVAYFQNVFNSNKTYDFNYWLPFKQQALTQQPELVNDVAEVRIQCYRLGFIAHGFSDEEAFEKSQLAVDYFVKERSNFSVTSEVHSLLAALQEKYTLISISNGNVNTKAIDIDKYFELILHADLTQKQKPSSDMFDIARKKFNLQASEILHVGDCGKADIKGAMQAGFQSAWLPKYNVGKPLSTLPTIELSELSELRCLLN
mgnify:CR=1 FL=1